MASWKIKGYVSDSEGEELTTQRTRPNGSPRPGSEPENDQPQALTCLSQRTDDGYIGLIKKNSVSNPGSRLHIDSPKSVITREQHLDRSTKQDAEQPNADSVADQLQRVLQNGIEIVRDVLTRSPSPQTLAALSDDSPLSSPPDSPVSPLPGSHPISEPHDAITDPAVTIHPVQRTLRQRSAIQQHPYSLEYARYVQRCNERGVKPVSLPRLTAAVAAHLGDESQESQFEAESQDDVLPSSPDVRGHDRSSSASIRDDEMLQDIHLPDDLVDLKSLLISKRYLGTTIKKSRKPLSRTNRGIPNDSSGGTENKTMVSRDVSGRHSKSLLSKDDQQNSFPSPPYSTTAISITSHQDFDQTSRRSSPVLLPTPLLSSEIRRRKRRVIEDDSQSASEIQATDVIISDSESESSDSEPQTFDDVRVMQKRVRGVLPASWWSIDRVRQEINRKKAPSKDYLQTSGEVGVAQRRKHLQSGNTSASNVLAHLYDELVSDDEVESTVSRSQNESTGFREDHLDNENLLTSFDGSEALEVIDDNGLDRMLPQKSRKLRADGSTQNIRRRPQASKTRPENDSFVIHGQRRRRKTGVNRLTPGPKRSKRSPTDLVHVLDAPDMDPSSLVTKPAFMRLAARQARKKGRDRGTSASTKFIHLISDDEFSSIKHARAAACPRPRPNPTKSNTNRQAIRSSPMKAIRPPPTFASLDMNTTSCDKTVGKHSPGKESDVCRGAVVSCQSTLDAIQKQRLTRLRSMLPITNRSGAGHLASSAQLTRPAQAEVLVTQRKKIILPKSIHRSSILSRDVPTDVTGTNTDILSQSLTQPQFANSTTAAASRQPRKRTPTHYVQPTQRVLLPHDPDSIALESVIGRPGAEVRAALEKQFSEYQNAWFQGSGAGFTIVNNRTQHHFHTFLEVLRSYLTDALNYSDDALSNRDLRSFLHRLVPNRGYIGAKGQVGNKSLDVYELDIIVARNVFELHACLLGLAPACAPRPRVLEMKVNFSDAHHEICMVALACWNTILAQHHTDPSIVDGLGRWIHTMISQLIQRWRSAEADAQAEANASMLHVDLALIRSVIERNREQTCKLLDCVLSALREGLDNATGQLEANSLFTVDNFQSIINTICHISQLSDSVVEAVLRVPEAYVQQQWYQQQPSIVSSVLSIIKNALTSLFADGVRSTSLVSKTADVYFTLAKRAVALHLRTWDDFVEPRSTFCPEMFLTGQVLQTFMTRFYTRLLEHDSSQYTLEFRARVVTHWVSCLYSVQADADATACLTSTLLRIEKQSLGIKDLALRIASNLSDSSAATLAENLASVRYDTAMHIIKNIHDQEHDSESDWMPGGLETNDCLQILRVMFRSMKDSWLWLEFQPEQQDIFMILIHAALDQYEASPRSDFSIEPWFFNSATFPPRRKKKLTEILCSTYMPITEAIKQAGEQFVAEVQYAKRQGQVKDLQTELQALFNTMILPSHQDEAVQVLDPRISFMVQAFSEYLNKESEGWIPLRTMLLEVIASTTEKLECYLDSNNRDNACAGVEEFVTIVSTLEGKMATFHDIERRLVFSISQMVFESAVYNLDTLPERFLENIGSICDYAAADDSEAARGFLASLMNFV